MPRRAMAASEAMRVADPSSREIQVSASRLSRDDRTGTSAGCPTITMSYSSNGSASISGPPIAPAMKPSSARCDRSHSTACAAVPSSSEMCTAGCKCRNSAMSSGSKYVPVNHEATIVSEPESLLRNWAAPRSACASRDSARNTWFAIKSPALVREPSRLARSTNFSPRARSKSATCFETAGWLMRSSAAAAEKDRRRANAAKARKRASSSITLTYTNAPTMYFYLPADHAYAVAASIWDARHAATRSSLGHHGCRNRGGQQRTIGNARLGTEPDRARTPRAARLARPGKAAVGHPIVQRPYGHRSRRGRTDRSAAEPGDLYRRQPPDGVAQRRYHRRVSVLG